MPDNSFDIVSKVEMPEVINAIQQADKELLTRFDLKNSKSSIALNEKEHKITLASIDEFKLKAITEILCSKSTMRGSARRFSTPIRHRPSARAVC